MFENDQNPYALFVSLFQQGKGSIQFAQSGLDQRDSLTLARLLRFMHHFMHHE